jgi:hypothetical protein
VEWKRQKFVQKLTNELSRRNENEIDDMLSQLTPAASLSKSRNALSVAVNEKTAVERALEERGGSMGGAELSGARRRGRLALFVCLQRRRVRQSGRLRVQRQKMEALTDLHRILSCRQAAHRSRQLQQERKGRQ